MIGKLDETLNFHSQALLLRAERQQLLSSNIVNADTPGYRAQDFDFAAALRAATGDPLRAATGDQQAGDLVRTSAAHLGPLSAAGGSPGEATANLRLRYRVPVQGSLDGNSVDLDLERAQFADNAVRYEAALRFLDNKIKSMLSVIQA